MRPRPSFVAALVLVAACGGEPRGPTAPASSASAAAPSDEDPCAVARAGRARVDSLVGEGRLHRALAVIDRANATCPAETESSATARARISAALDPPLDKPFEATDEAKRPMREAYKDAAAKEQAGDLEGALAKYLEAWSLWRPNGQALVQAGLVASRLDRAADAQRLFDRGLGELERASAQRVAIDADVAFRHPRAIAWGPRGRLAVAHGRVVSLVRASLDETLRLVGHEGFVDDLAFSPDGRRVVTSSLDGTVRVWDVDSGEALLVVASPRAGAFAFSADGALLAIAEETGVVLRSTADLGAVRTLDGAPYALAFSPDGKTLAITEDKTRIADASTGHTRRTFDARLDALAFSPDGARLAGIGAGFVPVVLDASSGKVVFSGPSEVTAIAFAPDGKLMIGSDADLEVLSLSSQQRIAASLEPDGVSAIAASPDGQHVATASVGNPRLGGVGSVLVWDTRTWKPIRRVARDAPDTLALAFSLDGKSLAAASADASLRVYTWRAGAPRAARWVVGDPSHHVAFAPDGKSIALAGSPAMVLDLATGAFRDVGGPSSDAVAFSPDGKRLAISVFVPPESGTPKLQLWDALGGAGLEVIDEPEEIEDVGFARDGSIVTALFSGGAIHAGGVRRAISFGGDAVACMRVAVAADGSGIGCAMRGAPLAVVDLSTGATLGAAAVDPDVLDAVAVGPGLSLAAASADGAVELRRPGGPSDGEVLARIRAVAGVDASVILSPDGYVEFAGDASKAAHGGLVCRVGAVSFPFEVCRERFEAPGLLEKLVSRDGSYRDP